MAKPKQLEAPVIPHPFRQIRRAGVPLVAYETGDPWASIQAALRGLNGKAETVAAYEWDCLRGLRPVIVQGKPHERALAAQGRRGPTPEESLYLAPMLAALNERNPLETTEDGQAVDYQTDPIRLSPDSIVFLHNAPRFLDDPAVVQGLCNLRDHCKQQGSTVVLLGPAFKLPAEIKDDCVTMEESSPTEDDISRIVRSTFADARANGADLPEPDLPRVVDTLLGYRAEFGVEQSLALALVAGNGSGVDMGKLWDLKVQSLKQTAGLEISRPEHGFDRLAGTEGSKAIFSMFLRGKAKPRAVVLADEIEKAVAGATGGDLSGTSQAIMEQLLGWLEARKVHAALLVGVPGCGKTATARAVAGEAGAPLLHVSMSTVKGSLVGQSEQQMRALLRAIDAVGQGQVLWLSTCNSLDVLSPELMARHKLATLVYDYPTEDEREALWDLYRGVHGVDGKQANPPSRNWVGREVESCCERAALFGCSLAEAAQTVVPIAVANKAKMDALRSSLSGRFLAAAHPGPYEYRPADAQFASVEGTGKRKMTL